MMARRSSKASDYGAVIAAAAFFLVALLAASWRLSLKPQPKPVLPKEPWERVKEEFPIPGEPVSEELVSAETYTAIIAANPFSAQRRQIPEKLEAGQHLAGQAEGEEKPPQFVYKGRMQLGSRQRAILEDLTSKKTYFLEVGQGVANFKVLDIDEKRVILSDPQSHEEVTVSLTTTAQP